MANSTTNQVDILQLFPGVIKQEAATRCGGLEGLKEAVAEGAVKKKVHKGHEMYFFPNVVSGMRDQTDETEEFARSKETTREALEDVQKFIDEMELKGYEQEGQQLAITDSSSSSVIVSSDTDEMWEKLNKGYIDATKALKVAEKISAEANKVNPEGKTPKFASLHDDLEAAQEALTLKVDDMAFMLKFKKTKAGDAIDVPSAKKLMRELSVTLGLLMDNMKTLRVLFPKKEKTT